MQEVSQSRPFLVSEFLLLVLTLLGAGGVRGWYLHACAESGQTSGPYLVQGEDTADRASGERDTLIRHLSERNVYTQKSPLAGAEEATAHAAPGYPWLLSLANRLALGEGPLRWAQGVLGTLTAGLYFLFARRAFGSLPVAGLAGALCALHPIWIFNVAELQDGVVTSFLLALVLWLGTRCGQSGGAFGSLLFGLSLAGLTLLRAPLLPFAFVAMLWFLLRCRILVRGWLFALLAFLGFANGLIPWTIRNYQTTGDIIPIVDSLYLHLALGNNPRATGGPMAGEDLVAGLAEVRGEEPPQLTQQLAALPERQRYASLAADVVQEISRNLEATVRRRLGALQCFLLGEKWQRDQRPWIDVTAASSASPAWLVSTAPTALLASLIVLLVLGAIGWRGTHAWRFEAMPSSLAIIWIPLPYILAHAESLHGPRLPLDGVLLCYAAFAICSVLPVLNVTLDRTTRDADQAAEDWPRLSRLSESG